MMFIIKSGNGYPIDDETLEITSDINNAYRFDQLDAASSVAGDMEDIGLDVEVVEI